MFSRFLNFVDERARGLVAVVVGMTFALLVLGALVHNTRSSLACPDWPLCYGQVMPEMVGGVLVEHSHRLLATTVGLLTIALAAVLYRRRRTDRELAMLGIVGIIVVVAQGVLGGITVIYRLPTWVSTAHLGTSMVFFALLLFAFVRLSPERPPLGPRAIFATSLAAAGVYLQLLLGAYVRHSGAGLSCMDWPLCQGQLFPSEGTFYVHLHMVHRLMALIVLALVIWATVEVWRAAAGRGSVRLLAVALPVLVAAQIVLGILSVTSYLGVIPVTLHLAVAAAIWGDLIALTFVARATRPVPSEEPLLRPRLVESHA